MARLRWERPSAILGVSRLNGTVTHDETNRSFVVLIFMARRKKRDENNQSENEIRAVSESIYYSLVENIYVF